MSDTYIKDGLAWCSKCNTPRQMRVSWLGREEIVVCLCDCQRDDQLRHEQSQKVDLLRRKASCDGLGIPYSVFSKWSFEYDDRHNVEMTRMAVNYVENYKSLGKGLLIYGGVGTGKTFMAGCIVNALMARGVSCIFSNFERIAQNVWKEYGKTLETLNRYDLLVIDDFASERQSEWMGEIVQCVINERYQKMKPIIVTTNLTGEDLKHPDDIRKERIYSRLMDMCFPMEMKGKDRRKEKLIENYQREKDMLE